MDGLKTFDILKPEFKCSGSTEKLGKHLQSGVQDEMLEFKTMFSKFQVKSGF